jgi:hypothetical protein
MATFSKISEVVDMDDTTEETKAQQESAAPSTSPTCRECDDGPQLLLSQKSDRDNTTTGVIFLYQSKKPDSFRFGGNTMVEFESATPMVQSTISISGTTPCYMGSASIGILMNILVWAF